MRSKYSCASCRVVSKNTNELKTRLGCNKQVQMAKQPGGNKWPARWPPVLSKNTNELKAGAPGVSIVIAPWRATDLGRVGGDVGDSGSPHAQGKHRPATGCHAPGRKPGSRPGPHLDQNVLAGYAAVASASILVSRVAFFPPPDGPVSVAPPYFAQTWHSKIGIRDECRK